MEKRVLDLNAGLGGRIYAFKKAGFEIVAAVDNDVENCEIMSSWMDEDKILNCDLREVDPDALPDADIITAKYIQHMSYESGRKRYDVPKSENIAIFDIIVKKNPILFLLEVPASSITSKRQDLEEYMQRFYEIGYSVSYVIYDEMGFSGYPMVGRQGYIIGCKIGENMGFEFPRPLYVSPERELMCDDPEYIYPWYRKLNFSTADWESGCVYLRTRGTFSKNKHIHMGYMRENYFIDQIGPRRFTHNELATLKGLHQYNYNKRSNKSRMYNKIAYATNVYVVEAIAFEISNYIYNDSKPILHGDVESPSKAVSKKKRELDKKILFPKRFVKEIKIQKLKGINNLSLRFDKNIVALMGVNGSGKSTILHALACAYTPYEKGENYKFSYFFTPNPHASWKGSCFTVINHDLNEKKDISKKYEKQGDRWARYASRPQRDVYFMGITSCIPEIELEKKTSFINYVSKTLNDKLTEKIILTASYILSKDYEELLIHEAGKKKYIGVHTKDGIVYSALSMGAGEQRVLKILQTVYSANQYSLILIDEIDLLLHADAFRKLIKKLSEIATARNLQIIFTTHSLEMQYLSEYADIRYIEHQKNKVLVYDSIKPDLLYKMSGEMKRKYSIYVEDCFAASIVRQIAIDLSMQRHISIITYGSIENAFAVAAGKVLSGEDTENVLIVTDGDRFVTTEEKIKRLKGVLTGTEEGHDEKIQQALTMIVQFNLPSNTAPEEYIHSLLISMDDSRECVACAKNITSVSDPHEWIGNIVKQMGIGEQIYNTIMDVVSEHELWEQYVSSVHEWIKKKREEVELICVNEQTAISEVSGHDDQKFQTTE